jgi:hypothetical protein
MLNFLFDPTLHSIFELKSKKTSNKINIHSINPSIILNPPYEHIQNMKPNIICINCFNIEELNINEINVVKYLNNNYNINTDYIKDILRMNITKIIIVINKNCYLLNNIEDSNYQLTYDVLKNHKFESILFESYLLKCLMKEFNFISLGLNCFPSGFLKFLQLKNTSYPFDWLQLSNFNNILDILNNNYENLFNTTNLILNDNCSENNELCRHNKYGKIFVHHCPKKNLDYFNRCMSRFINIISKKKNIFIIRIDIEKDYELLYNALKKINNNDFILIILKIISIEKQTTPSNDVNIDTYKNNSNIKIFSIHLKTTNAVGSLIQDDKSLYNLSVKFLIYLQSIYFQFNC